MCHSRYINLFDPTLDIARHSHCRLLSTVTHAILHPYPPHTMATPAAYFRITLMRSAIGLPKKTSGVLAALGLRKRLRTVYHPVTPDVAGQIFAVKELIDVQEVSQKLSVSEMKELRRPEKGWYVERRIADTRTT